MKRNWRFPYRICWLIGVGNRPGPACIGLQAHAGCFKPKKENRAVRLDELSHPVANFPHATWVGEMEPGTQPTFITIRSEAQLQDLIASATVQLGHIPEAEAFEWAVNFEDGRYLVRHRGRGRRILLRYGYHDKTTEGMQAFECSYRFSGCSLLNDNARRLLSDYRLGRAA